MRTVLLLWVYAIAHSGKAVSLVGLAEILPVLLVTPFGGVVVDRWSRGLVMTGGVGLAAALLLLLSVPRAAATLPAIVVVALLVGAGVQLSYSASSAAIPVVASDDELGQANSLSSIVLGGGAVVAPGLAAFLVATWGPRHAVLPLAALFGAAAIAYGRVHAPRARREDIASTFRDDLVAGLQYVLRSQILRSLLVLVALCNLVFGGLSVLDVVFVTRALHLPSSNVGLMLSATGLGELGGGIAMTLVAKRLDRVYHRMLSGAILIAGIAFLLYGASPALVPAVAALTLASVSYPPLNVAFATLQQRATPDALMGRVSGLNRSTVGLAQMVSLVSVGALADAFGVRAVIAAGGGALLGCGALSLLLLRSQKIRG